MRDRPYLAITMGDAAGIGPEVTAKTLIEEDIYQIGFDASFFTDRDMIEQFIQYHSAEIVIDKGYKY